MAAMTPFKYREFWDVPRAIVLRYRGGLYLLYGPFEEERDEYSDHYAVYALPESAQPAVEQKDWSFFIETDFPWIGDIPIKEVRFDETRRKELDASILDPLIDAAGDME